MGLTTPMGIHLNVISDSPLNQIIIMGIPRFHFHLRNLTPILVLHYRRHHHGVLAFLDVMSIAKVSM
jgi:hypothetical protein